MVGAVGAGSSGLIALLATSSWYGNAPSAPPSVPATKDGAVFESWAMDEEAFWSEGAANAEPNCSWWNGSVVYTSDLCSHFSLSRMASSGAARAIDRAIRCAAWYQTECVIAPEIGVSIPAAFMYDPEGTGMRMLIAPRILPQAGASGKETRTVRIQDPEEKTNGRVATFNHTVHVEYLPGGSRAPVSEVLSGSDAFCVQLLRAAFVQECWDHLD